MNRFDEIMNLLHELCYLESDIKRSVMNGPFLGRAHYAIVRQAQNKIPIRLALLLLVGNRDSKTDVADLRDSTGRASKHCNPRVMLIEIHPTILALV